MAKKRKKSSKAPFFLLILAALSFGGYYAYNHGPEEVKETADRAYERAKETVAPLIPSSDPTPPTPEQAPQSYTVGSYGQTFTYAGIPQPTTYPNSITVLENSAYIVGYDETRKNPAWVAYRVPAQTLPDKFPRPSRFQADPRTVSRVTHDDYTHSGFDRGHMAPNHAIASRFGEQAQTETFLMTNVVPQRGDLNQGPWRLLEETVATKTALAAGEVWVVTGPIFGSTNRLPSGVKIPTAFFKIIVDETPSGLRTQSFIMGQDTPRRANYRDFITTIDAIEEKTGLNFLHELPDEVEDMLESALVNYWLSEAQ